jgi:flagellar basal-body rod modification protein FlgD
MAVSAVDYSLPTEKTRVVKKELDKNDFLLLMVEQLQNQDPLEPQSNAEFVAQMAQFTSVEALSDLSGSMDFLQATMMIGKQVSIIDEDQEITGVVEKAAVIDSVVNIYVNGQYYDLKNVTQVENPTEEDS